MKIIHIDSYVNILYILYKKYKVIKLFCLSLKRNVKATHPVVADCVVDDQTRPAEEKQNYYKNKEKAGAHSEVNLEKR